MGMGLDWIGLFLFLFSFIINFFLKEFMSFQELFIYEFQELFI